jgi:hypothetical protein
MLLERTKVTRWFYLACCAAVELLVGDEHGGLRSCIAAAIVDYPMNYHVTGSCVWRIQEQMQEFA